MTRKKQQGAINAHYTLLAEITILISVKLSKSNQHRNLRRHCRPEIYFILLENDKKEKLSIKV